jgi:hypothetical protein
MPNQQNDYFSYLLRLWRETGGGQTAWRASLEPSLAEKRRVFASLGDLFEYLRQQTGVVIDADNDEAESET